LLALSSVLDAASAGWSPQAGEGINDAGVIVGHGTIGGADHAFVAQPVADLSVNLLGRAAPVGVPFPIDVRVRDNGPSAVGDVQVALRVSGRLDVLSAGGGAPCAAGVRDAHCTIALLQPGRTAKIRVWVSAHAAGPASVQAGLSDQAFDTDAANDTA